MEQLDSVTRSTLQGKLALCYVLMLFQTLLYSLSSVHMQEVLGML